MVGQITYLSEEAMKLKFGRDVKSGKFIYGFDVEFQVESYLRYQGEQFISNFDANTYLLMTKALDYFDPAADYGHDLVACLAHVEAKFFVASFSSDWRFSPQRSHTLVQSLIRASKSVQYIEVESTHGHDAFLMEDAAYMRGMHAYMGKIAKEVA